MKLLIQRIIRAAIEPAGSKVWSAKSKARMICLVVICFKSVDIFRLGDTSAKTHKDKQTTPVQNHDSWGMNMWEIALRRIPMTRMTKVEDSAI